MDYSAKKDSQRDTQYDELEARLCDGIIHTEDGWEFPIHRIILSRKSGYFKDHFCSQLHDDLFIRNISGDALRNILSYVYTGILEVNSSNIGELLAAADFLMMDSLLNECRAHIEKLISPRNCVQLLNVAKTTARPKLSDFCYRYIQTRFCCVVNKSGLEDLSFDSLSHLLSENSLNVEGEETVWKVVIKWISEDPEERSEKFLSLLFCLRLEDATDELIQEISDHPYFCESELSEKLSSLPESDPLKDRFLQAARDLSPTTCFSSRHPCKRFISIKEKTSDSINVLISFDERADKWLKLGERNNFYPDWLSAIDCKVYLFETDAFCVLDILQNKWVEMAPMNDFRRMYGIAKMDRFIYSIGGYSDYESVSGVERYESEKDKWVAVSSMTVPAVNVKCVSLNGLIYTLGVTHDDKIRDDDKKPGNVVAQVYDPDTDLWDTFSTLKVNRTGFAFEAYHDSLFAIGGNDVTNGRTVERYDIQEDVWTLVKELPENYITPIAAVLDDVLYVYLDESYGANYPPLYWDEDGGTWNEVETNSIWKELLKSPFCVIDDISVNKELMKKIAKLSSKL